MHIFYGAMDFMNLLPAIFVSKTKTVIVIPIMFSISAVEIAGHCDAMVARRVAWHALSASCRFI